jgi:glycosyltransferase involved in cell wall biosynthesis
MAVVSVVIPSYNSAQFVTQAVESALNQTAPAYEVIVVNDGSTDDTDNVMASYEGRVVYVKQPNQGVSAARNAGTARASGEWIVFLDADDRLHSRALENLVGKHGDDLRQVIYGDITDVYEDGRAARPRKSINFGGARIDVAKRLFMNGAIPPGAFAFPRWLVSEVGGFDTRFSYAADLHFYMRCACQVPFIHVPEVVLYYRTHGNNMTHKYTAAVRDTIEAKAAFQQWCRDRGLDVLGRDISIDEMVSNVLLDYCYRRNWGYVDAIMQVASEKGVRNSTVRKIERLRRLPKWVFTVKDGFDKALGSLSLSQRGR